jgi:hypothetical protein
MTGDCVLEACRLQLANKKDQGKVCYVARMDGRPVGHAYYVPDPEDLDAIALNQTDNGFPQFPRLTVREVLENNDPTYLSVTID